MTTPPPAVANPANLFDLTGRTALITGGSRGLGKEMALAFAHQGADIMIASRSIESFDVRLGETAFLMPAISDAGMNLKVLLRRLGMNSVALTSWSTMPASHRCTTTSPTSTNKCGIR